MRNIRPCWPKGGPRIILSCSRKSPGKVNLRHRRSNPYLRDGKALVSFANASNDIKADIQKVVDRIGGFEKSLKPQDRILLKPNFNSDDPPPGSTAFDFLFAVIDLLREHGYSRVSVGDGSGRAWVPTEKTFQRMGLDKKMAEKGVPLLNFEKSQYLDVPIGGDYLDVIAYPKDLESFDKIIYLPTMKTHHVAGFSLSLKLTVGLTHLADRSILHSDNNMFVSQRAAEMNIPVKPDLIIMDGRISFVSGGPAIGLAVHPKPFGLRRSGGHRCAGYPPLPELSGREPPGGQCLGSPPDQDRCQTRPWD